MLCESTLDPQKHVVFSFPTSSSQENVETSASRGCNKPPDKHKRLNMATPNLKVKKQVKVKKPSAEAYKVLVTQLVGALEDNLFERQGITGEAIDESREADPSSPPT